MDQIVKGMHRRRRAKAVSDGSQQKFKLTDRYYSKSIGRALDVLECFPDEGSSLSLREIGELLRLPDPSLYRILFTLQARKYLVRNADGSFGLSSELLAGRQQRCINRLVRLTRPVLQKLVRCFNETASLACLFDDRIQVVDTCETFHEVRMINKRGRVIPPHCSSLGKAITAFQDSALMEKIIEAYGLSRRTENSIVDRQELIDEFARVRAEGFAMDREECTAGGICLGSPIRLPSGFVHAAISISVPKVRMFPDKELEMIQALKEGAKTVEGGLRKRVKRVHAEADGESCSNPGGLA